MLILSLLTFMLGAAASAEAPKIQPLPLPEGPASTEPSAGSSSMGSRLVTGADGKTYLSWLETSRDSSRLRFARLEAGGWSAGGTIAEGAGWVANWADYPVLAVGSSGNMAATWLVRTGAEGTWDYGTRIAVSATGETWSAGTSLHPGASGPEFGFVSLLPLGSEFGAVWLDSRKMSGGHDEHGAGSMALYFRRVGLGDAGPVLGAELELDGQTCECCSTSAIGNGEGGIEVAYRDRAAEELRDIRVVGLGGADVFGQGGPLSDGWKIAGCPVNGPALTAWNGTRALVWFTLDQGHFGATTASPGEPAVKVAFSQDGSSYDLPIRLDAGPANTTMGRVSACFSPDGRLFVAWLEAVATAEEGSPPMARWMIRQVTGPGAVRSSGGPAAPIQVALVEASRSSGFGSLAWHPGSPELDAGLLFAYTRASDKGPSQVQTLLVSGL